MVFTQQKCTLPFTSKLRLMHAHPPTDPKSKGFYLKHSNHCFILAIQNMHAIFNWFVSIFVCEWTLLNKIVLPIIMFIVQWIKHAQTNPSLHALSSFFQIYSRRLLEEFKFINFFHSFHKLLERFQNCCFSNFVVVITSVNNLIVCKHAQRTFACLMEFNPTMPHAYFLYTK